MLEQSKYAISRDPKRFAATAVPTIQDWEQLWACWDLATRELLPEQEMLSKPIKLRNCCLFYLGHIPTFLDMHLTRVTNGRPTEPSHYPKIFERGIDPDVDNPEQCHAHSEIPEEWPPLQEILKFQEDVRHRVRALYSEEAMKSNPKLSRILPFAFEHEAMHLETFLYILLQSDHVKPPPGSIAPDFESLAANAKNNAGPGHWVNIPASTITIGRDDSHDNYTPGHFFSWDVEYPSRKVNVHRFEAQSRPLTNSDYAEYAVAKSVKGIPASWSTAKRPDSGFSEGNDANGHTPVSANVNSYIKDKTVRTVYGPVPLRLALDWPVSASYNELAGCAEYFNGRIPTFDEAQSIYHHAEQQRLKEFVSAETIPAVNGQLSSNGVHQTPPSVASQAAGSGETPEQVTAKERAEIYADLTGLNVGFNTFHPVPVTRQDSEEGLRLAGMGGVFEWTSSSLAKQEGFVPMDVYPVYSADFFDDKHNIILGGSWATHPRLAGRKTS